MPSLRKIFHILPGCFKEYYSRCFQNAEENMIMDSKDRDLLALTRIQHTPGINEQISMPFFYRKPPDSPLKTVQVHLFTDEASYLDNTRSDWSKSAHVTSLDFLARHRVYLRVINYVIMRPIASKTTDR